MIKFEPGNTFRSKRHPKHDWCVVTNVNEETVRLMYSWGDEGSEQKKYFLEAYEPSPDISIRDVVNAYIDSLNCSISCAKDLLEELESETP